MPVPGIDHITRVPGGALIAFEGVDGAGKTTQARLTAERLAALGYEVLSLREPSDGPVGRKLRALMSGAGERPSPEEEFRLFLQDRQEDVEHNIRPALERGAVVLIDRYYISSMAYQGARGLDPEMIREANERIAPRPHLTLLFELPLEESLARLRARSAGAAAVNPFELQAYQRRVHELFTTHPAFDPSRFPGLVRIDARRGITELQTEILGRVLSVLGRSGEGTVPTEQGRQSAERNFR